MLGQSNSSSENNTTVGNPDFLDETARELTEYANDLLAQYSAAMTALMTKRRQPEADRVVATYEEELTASQTVADGCKIKYEKARQECMEYSAIQQQGSLNADSFLVKKPWSQPPPPIHPATNPWESFGFRKPEKAMPTHLPHLKDADSKNSVEDHHKWWSKIYSTFMAEKFPIHRWFTAICSLVSYDTLNWINTTFPEDVKTRLDLITSEQEFETLFLRKFMQSFETPLTETKLVESFIMDIQQPGESTKTYAGRLNSVRTRLKLKDDDIFAIHIFLRGIPTNIHDDIKSEALKEGHEELLKSWTRVSNYAEQLDMTLNEGKRQASSVKRPNPFLPNQERRQFPMGSPPPRFGSPPRGQATQPIANPCGRCAKDGIMVQFSKAHLDLVHPRNPMNSPPPQNRSNKMQHTPFRNSQQQHPDRAAYNRSQRLNNIDGDKLNEFLEANPGMAREMSHSNPNDIEIPQQSTLNNLDQGAYWEEQQNYQSEDGLDE